MLCKCQLRSTFSCRYYTNAGATLDCNAGLHAWIWCRDRQAVPSDTHLQEPLPQQESKDALPTHTHTHALILFSNYIPLARYTTPRKLYILSVPLHACCSGMVVHTLFPCRL